MAMQEQKGAGGGAQQPAYPMQGHGPNGVGYGQPRQSYADGGFGRESRYDDGSMLHPAYNNPEYAK